MLNGVEAVRNVPEEKIVPALWYENACYGRFGSDL